METATQTRADPLILASAGSVALALFTFFVARDREVGIFIGLWAPTILAFGSYFRQRRMIETLDRALGKTGVIERVEQIVQGQ